MTGTAQMFVGAARAQALARVDLVDADALALRSIEVRRPIEAERFTRGHISIAQRVHVARDVGHMDRTATTVVLGIAIVVIFRALEKRQHVVVAPTGVTQRLPIIEIIGQTTHVHHGIDRTRPAQHLAARPETASPRQTRIGLSLVEPVDSLGEQQPRVTDRDLDHRPKVAAAGLEQQYAGIALQSQPARHDAPGSPTADDDVIECFSVHDGSQAQSGAGCCVISRCSMVPR